MYLVNILAEQLNISRTSVKKIIDQLKAEGCEINSVNHKGHQLQQLADTWYPGIVEKITAKHGFFQETLFILLSTQHNWLPSRNW